MFLSSQLSLATLSSLCSALRVSHGAGLSLVQAFSQQAKKGPFAARPVCTRISDRLKSGDSLEEVLRDEGKAFPPLFVSMITVGEQSGNLPEIFRSLEDYYREQLTLRRDFIARSVWPVVQFVGAVVVITLLILILGMLSADPKTAFDPIGLGVGPVGALKFLLLVAGFLTFVFGTYFFATRVLGKATTVHRILLATPVIGPCIQAICLTRMSLAMSLTMDTSISSSKAMRQSLAATGNSAYESCGANVAAAIKDGETVATALGNTRLFPEEFVAAVDNAEETGQIPEVMERQSKQYQELASLRMKALTFAASMAVWACVAVLIIWAILRIAFSIKGIYDDAMQGL
jgi:type IV pilus assembly protein PilC